MYLPGPNTTAFRPLPRLAALMRFALSSSRIPSLPDSQVEVGFVQQVVVRRTVGVEEAVFVLGFQARMTRRIYPRLCAAGRPRAWNTTADRSPLSNRSMSMGSPSVAVGEGAAQPFAQRFGPRFGYAVDHASDSLGGKGVGVVFTLHEDKFPVAVVLFVQGKNRLGGGAGARKGVEHESNLTVSGSIERISPNEGLDGL